MSTKRQVLSILVIIFSFLFISADMESALKEKSKASFDEMNEKLTLFFKDALTGKGIPGASFTLEDEYGTTNADGMVTIPFSGFSEMEKIFTGVFEREGYITSKIEVRVMAGGVFTNHYSISPKLTGKLRIIIDWDKKPDDLDAHFIKKNLYHISYRDMKSYEDQVLLDKDERNGFGPETITVLKLDEAGSYAYFIYDYTNREKKNSDALGKSRAHVTVYNNSRIIYNYYIKEGKGTMWEVFSIENGVFKTENKLN
ncbi:MAG TPA: hypothetical protein PLZ43_11225 [bacterium]|nr:hypothetical protein [bacterium]